VARQLASRQIPHELIESSPGRLNVYARIRGRNPGGGLMLFNHIDVVPAAMSPEWNRPPFSGEAVVDTVYGRGTLDMKALAICQLLAFAEVAASREPPQHDLVFLATADEETGSEFGMRWLIANRRDVFENVRYGVTEGGITEMMSEQMTYFGIEVGGKILVEVPVTATSRESLEELRIDLEPWFVRFDADRVLPEVAAYFRAVAPSRFAFKPYLADIEKTIREGSFWRLPLPYRDLVQNSVTMTAPAGAGGQWSAMIRLINLPDERPQDRLEWLRRQIAGHEVRLGEPVRLEGPVPLSATDTPMFRLLASTAADAYSVATGPLVLYRSGTDARFLRPLGIQCYGVSPYPVNFFQSTTIHAANERIRIDYFQQGIRYLSEVVRGWSRQA
jgi:acetylornithine deacetylase/succinyl-diaminopimelate desuccinylase-like protein